MLNPSIKLFFENMRRQGIMLTYDDVRLRTRPSRVLPKNTDVRTRISRNLTLGIPIVSSPMDTVTTGDMAIAMAEAGGLGIIHRGGTLSPTKQAKEVARVKHRLHGLIKTPITAGPDMTIKKLLAKIAAMKSQRKATFHTWPVVDDSGTLLGLLTRNDFDFCVDTMQHARDVMTGHTELTYAAPGCTREEAFEILHKCKKKVLPLVDDMGKLIGMFLFSDLKRILRESSEYNVDDNGQLLVGAAVGTGDKAYKRAELLAAEGCDLFQIDTAHGGSDNVIKTLKHLKRVYPSINVIAGNVSGGDCAKVLADAGADGILVGQGPGSICTTRIVAGIGVPQVSAIAEVVEALEGYDIPVIADGGIRNPGDIAIALALGAESVMLGRRLAGTEEAPGKTTLINGAYVKDYRGMGSIGALSVSRDLGDKYGQQGEAKNRLVPEGIESRVLY